MKISEEQKNSTEETPPAPNETDSVVPEAEQPAPQKPRNPKLAQFLQVLKFTGFSISAGVIQFVVTGVLSTWTGLIPEESGYYWIAYLAGLVLSVVWNFTFNRKFTFKAANDVPLAMGLVVLYYCAFAPLSTFGADAILDAWKNAAGAGWDQNYEMVITAGMMILNFVTEFVWDKFVVFNEKVTGKIKKKSAAEESPNETENNENGISEEGVLTEAQRTDDEEKPNSK